jgi:hypothetical protein
VKQPPGARDKVTAPTPSTEASPPDGQEADSGAEKKGKKKDQAKGEKSKNEKRKKELAKLCKKKPDHPACSKKKG